MIIIITIIKLLIILCIVATVHEFGHFIAAKLFKIGVNEFSIGFGPKIYQKKFKETMYSLRWIPFGGYVMIEGEGEHSDKENSFTKKNTFQKITVLVMGVVFNLILAVAILMTVSFQFPTYTTQITEFTQNSVLEKAGLQVNDKIISINGNKVSLSQDLIDQKFADNKTTTIEYIRDGKLNKVTLQDAVKEIGYIGVAFDNVDNVATNKIKSVIPGKAADKIGIKNNDTIEKIDGKEVENAKEIIEIIKLSGNKEVDLTIKRNSETIEKTIVPDIQNKMDLGIYDTKSEPTTLVSAFDKTVKTVVTVAGSYVDLFRGKVGIDEVSSIVGIGVVVSETNGFLEYLNLLAIISLAIGAANLLPFPPLDGGKIVFTAIEGITRKKIPLKVEAVVSYIGFGLLILLTIVVTFKDIFRLI